MIQEHPRPSLLSATDFIALAGEAFLRSDLAVALENYDRAIACDRDCADAHAGRALAVFWQGKPAEAQLAALRAVALAPTHLVALNVLAQIALANRDYPRARKFCECVLAIDPDDAEARLVRDETISVMHPFGFFDAYVSLGNNCEAGLQFQRIGCTQSSFFRFTAAPLETMVELIERDFAGVYERENLEPTVFPGLIFDRSSRVMFHSQLPVRHEASGGPHFLDDDKFDARYQQEKNKVAYLAEKWRRQTTSAARTVYFVKYEETDGRNRAIALRDLFASRYPQHDFTILFLQTEQYREADWQIDRVMNRYLSRFGLIPNIRNPDVVSWDRIFTEFPLRS